MCVCVLFEHQCGLRAVLLLKVQAVGQVVLPPQEGVEIVGDQQDLERQVEWSDRQEGRWTDREGVREGDTQGGRETDGEAHTDKEKDNGEVGRRTGKEGDRRKGREGDRQIDRLTRRLTRREGRWNRQVPEPH